MLELEGLAVYTIGKRSSIKQLSPNCDRIEAKQQSDTRSKSTMNLILRILIAKL